MGTDWELEQEEPEELDYTPKTHCVLEGSEQQEWGVVKYCKGCVNYIPEDAEVVGTWHKYGEGTFWVDLTTPLDALRDKAIQLHKELAERRAAQPLVVSKTRPSRSILPKTKPGPASFELNSLRDKLNAVRSSTMQQ